MTEIYPASFEKDMTLRLISNTYYLVVFSERELGQTGKTISDCGHEKQNTTSCSNLKANQMQVGTWEPSLIYK